MEAKKMVRSDCNGQLPEEVIGSEILTRLPVKCLMRFKCVCKSWYALLQTPNFIAAHCVFQQTNISRILVNGVKCEKQCPVSSILSDESLQPESYVPLADNDGVSELIVASVDGIICMLNHSRAIVWNPAIREVRVVPDSRSDHETSYQGHGFGYDSITDDYKVVRTAYTFAHRSPPRVEVYTLRSDCWRKLDSAVNWGFTTPCNVLLNGMFHWMTKDYVNPCKPDKKMLLSFDMCSELLFTTYLPDLDSSLDGGKESTEQLVSLKDSIAMVTFVCHPWEPELNKMIGFDIWILGEVGAKESWMKYFTIGPSSPFKIPLGLGLGKNGEIFFIEKDNSFSGEVAYYDVNTQMFRNLGFRLFRFIGSAVAIYSESLVSLMKIN